MFAVQIEHGDDHRSVEVLVARLAHDAELLQAAPDFLARFAVLFREPVAERAVGDADPEVTDHLPGA
jgi:hypothetical protein